MKIVSRDSRSIIALTLILSICIFLVDIYIPLGVAGGVPYVAVVFASLWLPHRTFTIFIALLCSSLTVLGYLVSPSGGELWKVLANRFLALFAIWITAFLGMARSRIEEKLRISEHSLEKAQQIADLGNYELNIRKNEITWSDQMYRLFGFEVNEVNPTFELIKSMVHPEDQDKWIRAEERMLKEYSPYDNEYRIVRKDGEQRVVHSKGEPLFDESGKAISMIGTIQDVTEDRLAEEALKTAHDNVAIKAADLKEANEELSQYSYVVSHDLKAPLRAIHNYAGFLHEDLEPTLEGEQKTYLNNLKKAVRQSQELIDDLLELTQVGRKKDKIEEIDLGGFFKGLIESLDLSPDVQVEMGKNWPTIETVPFILRQIFQNLIVNAFKFNLAETKRIEIGWLPAGNNYCELFVRDNGIGIEHDYYDQIFRVFQRLHGADEFEGTGLGLAIVKKASYRLKGSVRVESKPGEGSTFFVTLPKKQKGEKI